MQLATASSSKQKQQPASKMKLFQGTPIVIAAASLLMGDAAAQRYFRLKRLRSMDREQ